MALRMYPIAMNTPTNARIMSATGVDGALPTFAFSHRFFSWKYDTRPTKNSGMPSTSIAHASQLPAEHALLDRDRDRQSGPPSRAAPRAAARTCPRAAGRTRSSSRACLPTTSRRRRRRSSTPCSLRRSMTAPVASFTRSAAMKTQSLLSIGASNVSSMFRPPSIWIGSLKNTISGGAVETSASGPSASPSPSPLRIRSQRRRAPRASAACTAHPRPGASCRSPSCTRPRARPCRSR